MKDTASRIADAWKCIQQGHEIIAKAIAAIHTAQEECEHNWRFSRQVNNFHEDFWLVTYKCSVCDKERSVSKSPVCPADDTSLARAKKNDIEAEKERKKPEHQGRYNPPIAFRCPACQGIQILWVNGD
ncbi:hypothetical protein HYS79_01915 [Patescibacteria group bacterium]|nr:hypothetical protein [Patescibacteria group bacterium]